MAENVLLHYRLTRSVFVLLVVLATSLVVWEDSLADPPDTLDLQLQWCYPLEVVDMELADFDGDGINEILVGFYQGAARVGILDAASEIKTWDQPMSHRRLHVVTAGDRNGDGYLDIICGGDLSDTLGGYVEIRDGPTFDSVISLSGLDYEVLSAQVVAPPSAGAPPILLGTCWVDVYSPGWWWVNTTWTGSLFEVDGPTLAVQPPQALGTIRKILAHDVTGDGLKEAIVGKERCCLNYDEWGPDWSSGCCSVYSEAFGELVLYDIWWRGLDYPLAVFGSVAVSSDQDDGSCIVVASGTGLPSYYGDYQHKLACWNACDTQLLWCIEWEGEGTYCTGLSWCGLAPEQIAAVCASYRSGLLEFRDRSDGASLAVSQVPHQIWKTVMGNVDQDDLMEICAIYGGTLWVYEAPFITTGVEQSEEPSRVETFCLYQNYPNPFNPETIIRFTLPVPSEVTLSIYNILGQQIRAFTAYYHAGDHMVAWDGKNSSGEDVASGVYLYRLSAGQYQDTKKMLLIR